MTRCLSPEELRLYLDGGLVADAEQAAGDHVEACVSCQQMLEELTAVVAGPSARPSTGESPSGGSHLRLSDDQLDRLRNLLPPDTPTGAAAGRPPAPREETAWPTVPGYEIVRELGRGGMAVVYEARHQRLNRRVALKMIRAGDQASPEQLVRFCAEGEIVARLRHPNIVQIYEVGSFGKQPYFALELMEGGSLAQALGGKPQPARAAAGLVETLARAADYAHAQGVVHRDLNPANVLLQNETNRQDAKDAKKTGEKVGDNTLSPAFLASLASWRFVPKISDFGLAKQLDHDSRLTRTGLVMGTPSYMAPEQVRGQNDRVGSATDVYALGAILYEALTGRPPFLADTSLDVMKQVAEREPTPPSRLLPHLPRDLEVVCLKCLEKEPQRRYATAAALAEDLRRFLDGEPIHARRTPTLERAWRWARRRPTAAGLAAMTVLVTVVGFPLVTALWLQAAGARDAERQARAQAEGSLYFSHIARARLEWQLNHVAEAERLLDGCPPGIPRGWEWHYLKGLLHADWLTLPDRGSGDYYVNTLAFGPDGRLLSAGGNHFPPSLRSGDVAVWDQNGSNNPRQLLKRPAPASWLALHPDGHRFAAASIDGGSVVVADLATGQVLRELTQHLRGGDDNILCVAFSPDGRHLAAACQDYTVLVWDVDTGAVALRLKGHDGGVGFVTYSPDGRLLASHGVDAVRLWDAATGRHLHTLPQQRTADNYSLETKLQLAFQPDGRLLAVGGGDAVQLWDVAADPPRLTGLLAGHDGMVIGVAFHPDGRYVASGGADGTVRLWDVATGVARRVWRGHRGRVGCLAFDPTGTSLASGGHQPGDIKLWDVDGHPEHLSLPVLPRQQFPQALAFTPDGRRVVTVEGLLMTDRVVPARGVALVTTQDVANGRPTARRELPVSTEAQPEASPAALTAGGQLLAAVRGDDPRAVGVWDVETGREQASLAGHDTPVFLVALDEKGRRAAAAALDRSGADPVRRTLVWDVETGRPLAEWKHRPATADRLTGGLALSPDGERVAFDDYSDRASILICAAIDGRRLIALPIPAAAGSLAPVTDLRFSPDGRLLAASDEGGRMYVWDVATGKALHSAPLAGPCLRLAFSPDGRLIAGADRKMVTVWDVQTGHALLVLRGAAPRSGNRPFNPLLAWSVDGRRLAAVNNDFSTSVWDAISPGRSGREEQHLLRQLQAAEKLVEHGKLVRPRAEAAALVRALEGKDLPEPELDAVRGGLHGSLWQWERAAADYNRAFGGSLRAGPVPALQRALLSCYAGNSEGLARARRDIAERFARTESPDDVAHVLRGLTCAPPDGDTPPRLTEWVGGRLREPNFWHLYSLATAHYRDSDYRGAVRLCEESLRRRPDWDAHPLNWLLLAMAHHRLGETKVAAGWLRKAASWMDEAGRSQAGAGAAAPAYWHDWLECLILRREAEALLGPETSAP